MSLVQILLSIWYFSIKIRNKLHSCGRILRFLLLLYLIFGLILLYGVSKPSSNWLGATAIHR